MPQGTKVRSEAGKSKIEVSVFQDEFMQVHGLEIDNPEMARIMGLDDDTLRDLGIRTERMNFGGVLPWEVPMLPKDYEHLQTAQMRQAVCNNKDCHMHGQEVYVTYDIVTHKIRIPHSSTGNKPVDDARNQIEERRFGPRIQLHIHVGIFCPHCKKLIRFVKYNNTNRRAAKHATISGPHQNRSYHG